MASCQWTSSYLASSAGGSWRIKTPCKIVKYPSENDIRMEYDKAGWTDPNVWEYAYDGGPCEDLPAFTADNSDGSSVCLGGCMYAPQGGSGNTDTVHSGSWFAQLKSSTYAATGEQCPTDTPPPPPKSPKICGGGSCHDTAGHQYCSVDSGGTQVCIPEPPAGGGGCGTAGDTTICAGNGTPPPMPPNPPIADPVTGIASQDSYTHQEGGGPVGTTTVNNYNNTSSPPSNGAGPTDTAPQGTGGNGGTPSGDKPPQDGDGDKTSASGGGDCNSPPMCQGDAATCMVAQQTWLLRCPPGGDTSGAAGQDGNTDVPGLDGIGDGPGAGFIRSETVLDKLDTGGLSGGGTCPVLVSLDLEDYGVHMGTDSLPWCDILDKIAAMILFLSAFISLRILSSK